MTRAMSLPVCEGAGTYVGDFQRYQPELWGNGAVIATDEAKYLCSYCYQFIGPDNAPGGPFLADHPWLMGIRHVYRAVKAGE